MDRARRLVLAPLALTTLAAVGCGGDPPPEPASATTPLAGEHGSIVVEPEDRAGATRAQSEGSASAETAGRTAPLPEGSTTPEAPRPLVRLTVLRDVLAEDGSGGQAVASRATAIDLDARRFPARALDPVVHLGTQILRRYEHPRVGVLRFVIADSAAPVDGTPMFAQYEGDDASRVALGPFDRSAVAAEAP